VGANTPSWGDGANEGNGEWADIDGDTVGDNVGELLLKYEASFVGASDGMGEGIDDEGVQEGTMILLLVLFEGVGAIVITLASGSLLFVLLLLVRLLTKSLALLLSVLFLSVLFLSVLFL